MKNSESNNSDKHEEISQNLGLSGEAESLIEGTPENENLNFQIKSEGFEKSQLAGLAAEQRPIQVIQNDIKPDKFGVVFKAIEDAFPEGESLQQSVFPHPRNWVGPRFMAVWALPIIAIRNSKNFVEAVNPVRPYKEIEYKITSKESLFTASKLSFSGSKPMRFFGIRFMAIWVLPLAITGTVMEFLFISPLTGNNPFG